MGTMSTHQSLKSGRQAKLLNMLSITLNMLRLEQHNHPTRRPHHLHHDCSTIPTLFLARHAGVSSSNLILGKEAVVLIRYHVVKSALIYFVVYHAFLVIARFSCRKFNGR